MSVCVCARGRRQGLLRRSAAPCDALRLTRRAQQCVGDGHARDGIPLGRDEHALIPLRHLARPTSVPTLLSVLVRQSAARLVRYTIMPDGLNLERPTVYSQSPHRSQSHTDHVRWALCPQTASVLLSP